MDGHARRTSFLATDTGPYEVTSAEQIIRSIRSRRGNTSPAASLRLQEDEQ